MNRPFDPLEPLLEASRTQREAQHRAIAHIRGVQSMSRPLVLILSPYRGKIAYALDSDTESMRLFLIESKTRENVSYALECAKDSTARGEAPFASHLLYPQFLDDNDREQRRIGFECERAWIDAVTRDSLLVAVYMDKGLSEGMQETLEYCINNRVRVEFRKLNKGESK